jgi:hypothetical protein
MASLEVPRVKQLEQQVTDTWRGHVPQKLPSLAQIDRRMLMIGAGILLFVYLFFCYCCKLICEKAGGEPGVLVWLPLVQIFPMLRAARMPAMWFVGLLVPILNLVVSVLWCFKIAKARGKGVWVGIFLLLPVTNLLAFLYLAFSNGTAAKADKRVEIMTLEAA